MALKYKIGDRVRIKSIDWYSENKDKNGNIVFSSKVPHFSWCVNVRTVFTKDMVKFCGKVVTIESVWTVNYSIGEGTYRYYFTDEMIEGLVEEEEIEFTEEDKYWCDIMSASDPTTYVLPQGYQFVDEHGNVINATKIVLEKKEKEYPKTYEECCRILNLTTDYSIRGYRVGLLLAFQELLICRDAYWKIAGEEMGLDKPWEPDWEDYEHKKFVFIVEGNTLIEKEYSIQRCFLAFPTEEMRDAFYENFKELIEQCKELL